MAQPWWPIPSTIMASTAIPELQTHQLHMGAAIAMAQSSVTKGNHPFGAVLVLDGEIVCTAENTVHSDNDATCHAESNLCSIANKQLSVEQRKQATLYTSTEPCPMCSGAIYWPVKFLRNRLQRKYAATAFIVA